MPLSLSSIAIEEKNKLATDSVWLLALEISIPGFTDPLLVVRNNEDVTWRGETWAAIEFELNDISEESKGEIPQVELRIGNVNRAMEAYIHQYDLYCKTNGFEPIEFTIYVLNTNDLASGTPVAEHFFELTQPKANETWMRFSLGAANPFNKRWPPHRILRNHCRFRFNYPVGDSPLCGAPDLGFTDCDKTLSACRVRSNSARFGGEPGAGSRGLRLA